jgi:DNA-binding response OmpR family regulator
MEGRKMRVLLVEDDPVFRRGLALLFDRATFEVMQADNGNNALEIIGRQELDLVICDYRLPGADGLKILTSLREAGCSTPFILVTAHYSEELASLAAEVGATAVCEKPIALERFKQQCRLALGQQ